MYIYIYIIYIYRENEFECIWAMDHGSRETLMIHQSGLKLEFSRLNSSEVTPGGIVR